MQNAMAAAPADAGDDMLSEVDALMAKIGLPVTQVTPAAEAAVDQAAEAVTETIETEPANDITKGDLLAEVAEANDIMVVELEQPEQFVPADLVGEIVITGTADDALIPGDIPSFSEIDTSAIAGELLDLTPAPAEVLPAPVEPAPVDSRAEIKEAHGIVPANDPVITILVQTFKVLAKDDPNHAMFANTEPNSETVQLIMMSTGLEGSIDEITKKATAALKIAKDELSAPPPRRGRKAAAAGTTAAAAAGSAASAPRVPKSPSSKVLTYTPFVGHGIATAGIMADLQGRTKLIGLPDQLLWESTAHRGPKNRDQLDHSRPESYAPVMPCLHRLANTGNAFPADVNDPVVQPSAEKYRPLAAISYATFEALKAGPIEAHNDVTMKGIIEGIGQVFTNETRSAVIDTLRSLWTVGLVTRETAGGRKQRYTLVAGATPSV